MSGETSDGGNPDPWTITVPKSAPRAIDEGEVRRALGLMVDRGNWVQIQSLPGARFRHHPGSDLDALVATVADLGGGSGTYLSLNPFGGNLAKAVKNSDILARRWFLIDPDAKKADPGTGRPVDRNASTTDEEKGCSRRVTEAIRDFLEDAGWPDPIDVDSGNNWQLLYRVDLPNDRLSQQILAHCLRRLGDRFDTERVTVDRGVHDARRICKVPGTMVRKGRDTPDRPWRMSRIVSSPTEPTPVPVALLMSVAGLSTVTGPRDEAGEEIDPPTTRVDDPWTVRVGVGVGGGGGGRDAWARAVLAAEVARVAGCTVLRNQTLHDAAWKVASVVAEGGIGQPEARSLLADAARACGLGTDGDANEIGRAIDNGFAYGLANPRHPAGKPVGRTMATKKAKAGVGVGAGAATTEAPGGDPSIIVRASEIAPRRVEWLWPGRIPLGMLTTFAGIGGLGKTFVLCDIAARITRGDSWPDDAGAAVKSGQVIFVSGEDDPDDTLVPRMIEMGAVLERIVFLKSEVQDRFTLADLATLDKAIAQAGPDVSLVVIDPPTAFLGGCDDHKNADLRSLLSPLKSWASRHRVAIIFNTHVSKPQGTKVEALMRVMGSVAWVNTVRAAHIFARSPDDPSRRLFVGMKLNVGKERKGLEYQIVDTETFARVEWLGEVDCTADEAMNGDRKKPRAVVATEWATEQFRIKREWTSDDIVSAAREAGISRSALFSPEVAALPILKVPTTHAQGKSGWVWRARPGWPLPLLVEEGEVTAF